MGQNRIKNRANLKASNKTEPKHAENNKDCTNINLNVGTPVGTATREPWESFEDYSSGIEIMNQVGGDKSDMT